jgi:outer membrane protein assembly factor BamB
VKPDGTEKWSFATGGLVQSSPAIGTDGTIYVGSYTTLHAVSLDGKEKWAVGTPNQAPMPDVAGGYVRSSPAMGADGTIYLGCDAGYMSRSSMIFATDPDHAHKWWFAIGGMYASSSPAIGADGTIYVGSVDGGLHAIQPNGEEKWRFSMNAGVESSPAIGAHYTIYVGCLDGRLCAIGETTPATSYWGNVTVDGARPADGINITAVIGGVQYAYTATTNGRYLLHLPGDDPYTPGKEGYVEGDQIYFYVGDSPTDGGPYTVQSGDAGQYIRRDLTVPEAPALAAAASLAIALLARKMIDQGRGEPLG